MNSSELDRIHREYSQDYRGFEQSPQHPWHFLNPLSIYYRHVQERLVSQFLRNIPLNLNELQCLDIGCGFGGFIRFLASSGVNPRNIHGIDITPGRVSKARSLAPASANLLLGDASHLPYLDACFALVSQFTVVSSIFEPAMRTRVCQEMQRVLLPGGYLIWYDMYRTRSRSALAIHLPEIKRLFSKCQILEVRRLHSLLSGRAASVSQLLSMLLDKIPGMRKTHYLILLKKR